MKSRVSSTKTTDLRSAINDNLPFLIATELPSNVSEYPDVFELGQSEYGLAVDIWLEHCVVGSSEVSVVSLDGAWLNTLGSCVEGAVCLRDQHAASSGLGLRPDATLSVRGAIGLREVSKPDAKGIQVAREELASKMSKDSLRLFPAHQSHIIGIATSDKMVTAYYIHWSAASDRFETTEFQTFNVENKKDCVAFVVLVFKLARWLTAITGPTEYFHLFPSIRTPTRNRHHVTLLPDGLLKEFNDSVDAKYMDRMQRVVVAKLNHVEWGVRRAERVFLIYTVGDMLSTCLNKIPQGEQRLETKRQIVAAVKQGLANIHSMGFAHCDICIDNVFVHPTIRVFLDDLEYLTL